MPGLLLGGGGRKEDCTNGNWQEAPLPPAAPREGPLAATDPRSPGNTAPSRLLPPREEMPGPSNRGLLVASCPLSIHPLWPLNPRGWFLLRALISQASDTQLSSSLLHGPPSWLPLSFHAGHSASLPAPFLQEVFPDSPLPCLCWGELSIAASVVAGLCFTHCSVTAGI